MNELKFTNKPYIIKKEDINTIHFSFLFPYSYDYRHMYDLILIKQIVANTSDVYQTEQEFQRALLKNMIINYSVRTMVFHNNLFLEFGLTVPNPEKVKTFKLEEAFQFFMNSIYHPNTQNNEFNHDQFSREKDFIQMNIQNSLKNIYEYSYQHFINYFDEKGVLKNNIYQNIDLLEQSNPKDLLNYYNKLVINNEPICFVHGDVDEKEMNEFLSKYLNKEEKNIIIYKDYNCFLTPSFNPNNIEEKSHYKQSALYMGYKIQNMVEEDKEYLSLICNIINGPENDLIFKALRIENNLIYSPHFGYSKNNGIFYVEVYLEKEAKEKAIQIIKDVIASLTDEQFLKQCLEKVLKGMEYKLIEQKDSKYAEMNDCINQKLQLNSTLEERYHFYKKLDIKKTMEFLKRIQLDTIYFLRGENDEKK